MYKKVLLNTDSDHHPRVHLWPLANLGRIADACKFKYDFENAKLDFICQMIESAMAPEIIMKAMQVHPYKYSDRVRTHDSTLNIVLNFHPLLNHKQLERRLQEIFQNHLPYIGVDLPYQSIRVVWRNPAAHLSLVARRATCGHRFGVAGQVSLFIM